MRDTRGCLQTWGLPNVLSLAFYLQYAMILYIRILVLAYTTINLAGLDESLTPKSFDVKIFIQKYDENGPTSDAIFIIKTMVPGFYTIEHPLLTLSKLNVS